MCPVAEAAGFCSASMLGVMASLQVTFRVVVQHPSILGRHPKLESPPGALLHSHSEAVRCELQSKWWNIWRGEWRGKTLLQ